MQQSQSPKPTSRRWRVVQENLTAYAFLSPALLLIFLFGIFPLGFAFFVSLHDWRRFPGDYVGLGQYVRALDGLAYVLFIWLGVLALAFALRQALRVWRQAQMQTPLALLLSASAGLAIAWVIEYIASLLPVILDIPQRLRGQERVQGLFVSELWASFNQPELVLLGNRMLLGLLLCGAAALLWRRFAPSFQAWVGGAMAWLYALVGFYLLILSAQEIQLAVATARANDQDLPIWSQIIFISLGVACVYFAYRAWRQASQAESTARFAGSLLAAIALLGGGYLLIAELPRLLGNADPDVLRGLGITVLFAIGTVPFQLAIGMGLAVLLFQEIRGKAFFRMVYFLPYITPFIATSIVFNLLFSHRPNSPINTLFTTFGLAPQKWLLEPKGIFELLAGTTLPDVIAGPGLALVVIMIYTIWTYIGYDTVVFLAGLGNIPRELHEAARIDGANEWQIFRAITFPLLSPTTFFLLLIAITGTFRAFTQIYMMRTPAAASAVDTLGLHIFETVRNNSNMGYGSAMSFVLFAVIVGLTVVQNRISSRRVFYG